MTASKTREATARPAVPSRATEKHENNIHALALHSLGIVNTTLQQRWRQRVMPVTHSRAHMTWPS